MLAQSNVDSSYAYNYAFNPIGNRLTASQTGTNWSYGTNALNQYAQLTTNLSSAPTYDADGNVLSRSSHHPTQPLNWNYEWNGENRLIRVTNIRDVATEMSYDYMGRRIEKKVYAYAGGLIGFLQLQSHRRYVYDGYKLVEELDALNNNALIRRYTWQPDAAGLDVPLSVYDTALDKTYYYHTDANKNVTELTDEAGNVVAHYEYSPFGQITKQSGSYADANPFRFSSEYYDAEIKLIYYNYRHYDPELGRWLSRDPIEEDGGWNLYNMVDNNPIIWADGNGNGILEYLLTGKWKPSGAELKGAQRGFGQGLFGGLSKWLYTGKWDPTDEEWDAATDGANDGISCYVQCINDLAAASATAAGVASGSSGDFMSQMNKIHNALSKAANGGKVNPGASSYTSSARMFQKEIGNTFGRNSDIYKHYTESANKYKRSAKYLKNLGKAAAQIGVPASVVAAAAYCAEKCKCQD